MELYKGGVTPSTDTPNDNSFSMQFNGTEGFINLPYPLLFGLNTTSLCFWIKTSIGGGLWVTTDNCGILYESFGVGLIQNRIKTSNDGSHHISSLLYTILTDNMWHLLTITNGSNQQKIYVDCIFYEVMSASSTNPSNKSNRIGAYSNSPFVYFNGKIDNVRAYNRVITPQ